MRTLLLRAALILAALLGAGAPLAAQEADTSAVPAGVPFFAPRDALVAGGFLLGAAALAPLDRALANRIQDSTTQANRRLHVGATAFNTVAIPGSFVIGTGLYAVGRAIGDSRTADLGLHGTEALVVASTINTVLKGMFGRARPYRDPDNPFNFGLGRGFELEEYRSFPSGHTVAAFAGAAALTSEAGREYPEQRWWIGTLLYGGAGLVGVSRMYDNKHWASDVVVGAALGTFAGAKTVRFNHSHTDNPVNEFFLQDVSPAGAVLGTALLGGAAAAALILRGDDDPLPHAEVAVLPDPGGGVMLTASVPLP